jgi:hypothetical protein
VAENDGGRTYPRGVPAVRDWAAMAASRAAVPTEEAHPAPSVLCRPVRPEELCRAAAALLKAVRAPWAATATYSRGAMPGVRTGEVETVAVRLRRPGARAWAVWVLKTGAKSPAWSFYGSQVVDEDGSRTLGATEVAAMVKGAPDGG